MKGVFGFASTSLAAPSSSILPSIMTASRTARNRASSWLWVTSTEHRVCEARKSAHRQSTALSRRRTDSASRRGRWASRTGDRERSETVFPPWAQLPCCLAARPVLLLGLFHEDPFRPQQGERDEPDDGRGRDQEGIADLPTEQDHE